MILYCMDDLVLYYSNFCSNIIQKKKKERELVLNRKRKSYVKGYNKSDNDYHPDTIMTHYRQLYYEALDCLINSLKERFTQASFVAYEMLESFLF